MKKMILMATVILSTSLALASKAHASKDPGAQVSCGKSAGMTLTSNQGKYVAKTTKGDTRGTTGQKGQN